MNDKPNIGLLLFEKVPEYKVIFDSIEDNGLIDFGSHLFFNEYATTVSIEIRKSVDSDLVINSMNFINELGESEDDEILNLIYIGILEILYTEGIEVRRVVNGMLSKKNKKVFESFSKHYN